MSNKKTYRKYAATTMAAAAAVASVAPVATAADTSKEFSDVNEKNNGSHIEAIYSLVERGIITGYSDNTFRPANEVSRLQVAKMIQRALELDVPENAEEILAGYSDLDGRGIDQEGLDAIAAVTAAGYLKGVNGQFDPTKTTPREQMASILVRAYDLEQYNTDEVEDVKLDFDKVSATHRDNVQTLVNLGISTEAPDFRAWESVTREQFATFLYRAINFVEEAPVEDVEPAVESVSAINASEIVVNFNTEVNEATAKDSTNYEIKVNNNPIAIADVAPGTKNAITVASDKKSVIIRLAAPFQNGDKYVIQTNDAIKSAKGEAFDKFVSEEKTFAESAEPKLLSVTPGTNSLTVEFDRPVRGTTPLVKVDGYDVDGTTTNPTPLTATSNAAGNYKYTVDVTDADARATIFEKGNHEVIIYDVQDTAAQYPATASVLTGLYTITDEVTVPEVKEVVAVNANRFFLRTNVEVDLATAKLTVEKGNHEFALVAGANAGFTTDVVNSTKTEVDAVAGTYLNANDHGVWVIVTDADPEDENPLYKGSETSANLKVTLENYKDAQTNSLLGKKSVTNVTLNKNNTKPEVEETKVNGSKLEVKFGNIIDGTLTESDVVVRDKDGVIITTGASSVSTTGDTVEIDLGGSYKVSAEPYTVEFKADKFKYVEVNNLISTYLVNTLKNDKITTSVKSTSTNFKYYELALSVGGNVTASNETVEITYPVEMDESARNVANYQIDGKALPAGSTVDFVDGKEKVRIVLPKGSLVATTSYKLSVSTNVKTKEGSIIVGSLQTKAPAETIITLTDNIAPELVSATYLRGDEEVKTTTSTDTIELTFSENVEIHNSITSNTDSNLVDDLVVVVEGTKVDVVSIDEDSSNDRRLIITLGQEVNVSQAATITVVPEEEQTGDKTTYIVDTSDNKAKAESSATANTSKFSSAVAGSQVDQNAANAVITQINAANTQTEIEAARTAYDNLTSAQKALVTNEAALQTKEQDLVDGVILDVTTAYTETNNAGDNIVIDAQTGFTFDIQSSDDDTVIDDNGVIVAAGTAELTVEVTHTSSGKTAIKTVSVTVAP